MKTLIEMAQEAGFEVHERKQQARVGLDAICGIDSTAKLKRFAELIRADEREACAKLSDEYAKWAGSRFYDGFTKLSFDIRARSQI
jgi:hypothetical protein